MDIKAFNELTESAANAILMQCCGATEWAKEVANNRPYFSKEDLFNYADIVWSKCDAQAGLEAFTHHPKIGDVKDLEKKFANTSSLSKNEQKSVETASKDTLIELAKQNEAYEEKFGFIFIVCATGKTAQEMLNLLNDRIDNSRDEEIKNAMAEQGKIMQLRLKNLIL